MRGELDADRGAVASLRYWAVNKVDMQYAVRVCSKSMPGPGVNDSQRLKRVARYVTGCPDTGSMFAWPTHRAKRLWLGRRREVYAACMAAQRWECVSKP